MAISIPQIVRQFKGDIAKEEKEEKKEEKRTGLILRIESCPLFSRTDKDAGENPSDWRALLRDKKNGEF